MIGPTLDQFSEDCQHILDYILKILRCYQTEVIIIMIGPIHNYTFWFGFLNDIALRRRPT